ncbi:MAG TPA: hypothetical protein VM840_04305 [Actinomycetota bacterium]|jgi:hypothetical protein|nr:hypothetical protein [Vitreimonas sp.]HVL80799.1 hypothetical protein [Actinomycetota bacterium]
MATDPENGRTHRSDAESWAKPVSRLEVGEMPEGAINLNVAGKRLSGPVQGFGRLWQKAYRMRLPASVVSASDLVAEWKRNFGSFWPTGNRFYGPLTSLEPGDVAVLNVKAGGGMTLSTGVMVVFADEEAFTFMTPQGHMFAAMITFSARTEGDDTLVTIEPLLRTNDPIYELGWPVIRRKEDAFWVETMRNLASHFGVEGAEVETVVNCVDRRRQWRNASNIWHNAGIRSTIYMFGAPVRWFAKPFRRAPHA